MDALDRIFAKSPLKPVWPQPALNIRFVWPRDWGEVLATDATSYPAAPWRRPDLKDAAEKGGRRVLVAHTAGGLVGFLAYDERPSSFDVTRLGVRPEYRRQTVGRRLVSHLLGLAAKQYRRRVGADVRETDDITADLRAHMFLKACGFRASVDPEKPGVYGFRFNVICECEGV